MTFRRCVDPSKADSVVEITSGKTTRLKNGIAEADRAARYSSPVAPKHGDASRTRAFRTSCSSSRRIPESVAASASVGFDLRRHARQESICHRAPVVTSTVDSVTTAGPRGVRGQAAYRSMAILPRRQHVLHYEGPSPGSSCLLRRWIRLELTRRQPQRTRPRSPGQGRNRGRPVQSLERHVL